METTAQRLSDQNDEQQLLLLRFGIEDNSGKLHIFAINSQRITSVVEDAISDYLPPGYEPFIGILWQNETPIPIIDLSTMGTNQAPSQPSVDTTKKSSKRIIICDYLGKRLGLRVSMTKSTITVPNSEIMAPPLDLTNLGFLPIMGFYRHKGEALMVFDADLFFTRHLPKSHTETSITHSALTNLAGARVLLAEDSELISHQLTEVFRQQKIQLTTSSNGEQAWQQLQGHPNEFDVIVTDIEMPLMNGIVLAKLVRENPSLEHLPIIFHSSISNQALQQQVHDEKLGLFVNKMHIELLLEMMEQAIIKKNGFALFR